MRKFIATLLIVAALIAFGGTPVAAADLAVKVPPALHDKGGTITLKVQYRCTQFAAPYNASDAFSAAILRWVGDDEHGNSIVHGYFVQSPMTCDGHDRKVTLTMVPLREGGLTGKINMEVTHYGIAADGSSGVSTVVTIPVTVR